MNEVLLKYFDIDNIKLAFNRVNCWPNRMVKDQVGLRAFKADFEKNCTVLSEKIVNGQYRPQRGFKFYVPKPSKTLRTMTLLFLEDAIVYQAIADRISELNYSKFEQYNSFVFGSVLNQEVKKGVDLLKDKDPVFFLFQFWKGLHQKYSDSIIQAIEVDKVKFKFETDITGFFDSIPHYNLLSILSIHFGVEDEILDLLGDCLNIWSGTKEGPTPGVGIPQGPVPSFLLANLLLHELDKKLIEHGYRYYRYMDDISIYSYDETELLDALLIIDKYTKANALSINSKKTSIKEITEGSEDQTVKELKRARVFSSYDTTEFLKIEISTSEIENKIKKNIKKDFQKLSDQDPLNLGFDDPNLSSISDPKEIIEHWQNQMDDVEKEIITHFDNNKELGISLKDGFDDLDAIRLSAAYGIAIRELRYLEQDRKPNSEILKYWLFFYEKYFWRADMLGYTLMNYRFAPELKKKMNELLDAVFSKYEWGRYQIIQNLSLTQNFSEKELRQFYFKILKTESSNLVKIALYRLLYKHAKTDQLRATLKHQLNREEDQHLKVVIAEFNKFHNSENTDLDVFLNSIGL